MTKHGIAILIFWAGLILLCAQTSFTATYTFGSDGNVQSFAYNGSSYEGLTFSSIQKVGVTSSSSSGNFRATGWPTGATDGSDSFSGSIDLARYIGFNISAAQGYQFTVSSISFGLGRSATGTRQAQWRGSLDSYASGFSSYSSLNAGLTNSSGTLTNPDANSSWTGNILSPGSSYIDLTTTAGFRLYLFNAEASGGTAGLQGPITISGTVSTAVQAAPTLQTTGISFSNVTQNGMDIAWTSGNGAQRLVLVKAGAAVNSNPSDGSDYNASSVFGSGDQLGSANYAVYEGSGNSFSLSGLSPSTSYYVRVYEFNGTGTGTRYNISTATANPSSQSTTASLPIPDPPVATAASLIGDTYFTANWNASVYASSYRLDVYTQSAAGGASELFISEYVEGSSNNKYLELFNGTGSDVDLSDYRLRTYDNGNTSPGNDVQLSGTLTSGACKVYQNSSAALTLPAGVSAENNTALAFNGDDAVALHKISSSSNVDIFGRIGEDPGNAWTSGSYSTVDKTLVRKAAVSSGIIVNPTTGFPALSTEWDQYPTDTVSNLGSHSFGSGREITYVPGYQNLQVYGTSQVVSGLAANTTYYYVVRAENASGVSSDSNIIEITTLNSTAAPAVQASNLVFYAGTNSISAEWTPGSGSRRLVKINTSNSFNNPINGSDPVANPVYSGAGEQVIYNGSTELVEGLPYDGVTVTGLAANTLYWIRIYEYNGSGGSTLYNTYTATGNPLSCLTLNTEYSGYYASVSGYGDELKADLHYLIRSTHTTEYSYTAATEQLKYSDADINNSSKVIEIYTGWSVLASDYGNETTDWNKEHTWSKSHGDFGDTAPAGTDLHHLRPSDATVNSAKSNKDFDTGGTAYTDASPPSGYSGNTGCYQTTDSWEPRNEDKGDVARIIMYMATRYEGTDTSYDLEIVDYIDTAPNNEPFYGKLSTLLSWHVQDPPDAWELRRNNRIQERQGNRNPFIDEPSFAQKIWAPCPLAVSNVSSSGFTASWSTPIDASRYHLDVSTDPAFSSFVSGYQNYNAGLSTSKAVTGLSANTSYYFRLRSWFVDDYGMYSPVMSVTLPTLAPLAYAATAEMQDAFTARWESVSGASSYRFDLLYQGSPVAGWTDVTCDTNWLRVTDLSPSTAYSYRIRTINQQAYASANSEQIFVNTTALSAGVAANSTADGDPVLVLVPPLSGTGIPAFSNLDLGIDPVATDQGDYNVSVSWHPSGYEGFGYFRLRYLITPSADLMLPGAYTLYHEGLGFIPQTAAYRWGGQWYQLESGSFSSTASQTLLTIGSLAKGRAGDLEIVIGEADDTLPVTLSAFYAYQDPHGHIALLWVTESETNCLGFHVYRSSSNNLQDAVLISDLIPAANSSQQQSYLFVDSEYSPSDMVWYWLLDLSMGGASSYHGPISHLPGLGPDSSDGTPPLLTGMDSLYPNPFNPRLSIRYSIAEAAPVKMVVYDLRGQRIRTLHEGWKEPGRYLLEWDASNDRGTRCASGIYYIVLESGKTRELRKVVLMK